MSAKQKTLLYAIVVALAATLVNFATANLSQHSVAAQSGGAKVTIPAGASTNPANGFSPKEIKVKVGDTVTWTNNDNTIHTVISGTGLSDTNKGKDFDSGLTTLTSTGKTYSHQFTKAGDFPYFCELHPAMIGKVTVS
ncbi:MAG TPA: plastocyanin/azurin family copper-binding protein [Nitrososphaeraceae archaeon]|nr:plastocyanin/azurin family copper-binding protein [Nitrososphaeraceae archaeon]